MGWKTPERNTISLKDKEHGTSYVGIFQGSKVVNTPNGDSTIWSFMDDEDKPFSMWGFSNLNFQLENMAVGTKCRVTFLGKSKTKNKFGKFPYQSKVEVWQGDEDADKVADEEVGAEVGE